MEYAILIHSEESALPETWDDDARTQTFFDGMNAFSDALRESGEYVAARRLQTVDTATTVRLEGERALFTDGPFAETKESLAGFFLVECTDLDRALQLASELPAARLGTIEVRPIHRGRRD